MEDPLLNATCSNSADFISIYREDYHFVKAIFIGEIQHMKGVGLFIKGIVDAKLNVPIWVSGSSSFDLHSKTRESLAGRAVKRILYPFSTKELIDNQNPVNPLEKQHRIQKNVERTT